MDCYINPAALTAGFTVPADVADKHLKLARGEHIKVLLYIMRNMGKNPADEEIAAACGITAYEVKEALIYWRESGILLAVNEEKRVKP
ncbi:MAG TPA: DNA replication protein DnaD, partial [Ruminococcaceae bacterium]|nr:DNA replication protein DnaD [Oscillospiraceae bacterium]